MEATTDTTPSSFKVISSIPPLEPFTNGDLEELTEKLQRPGLVENQVKYRYALILIKALFYAIENDFFLEKQHSWECPVGEPVLNALLKRLDATDILNLYSFQKEYDISLEEPTFSGTQIFHMCFLSMMKSNKSKCITMVRNIQINMEKSNY